NQAFREVFGDKGQEDIVVIIRVGRGIMFLHERHQVGTDLLGLQITVAQAYAHIVDNGPITGFQCRRQTVDLNALLDKNIFVLGFERVYLGRIFALFNFIQLVLVEKYRRAIVLIESKHQDTDQQNGKLHRDFQQTVHQQADAAVADRRAGQVAPYLTLVRTEIGQLEEKTSNQTAPQRVLVVPVKR